MVLGAELGSKRGRGVEERKGIGRDLGIIGVQLSGLGVENDDGGSVAREWRLRGRGRGGIAIVRMG